MASLHSYKDDDLYFHAIEQHASKAKPSDAKSYDSLIDYLELKIDANDPNHDLLLVRAILKWICKLTQSDLSDNMNSPGSLIKQMRLGMIEYSKVFKIFCGYADIDCEVITGRAKAIRYQAGDGDSPYIQGHTWNAFKANNKWHLIHPQWCIHSIVGYQQGGEYRIANDGKQAVKRLQDKPGDSLWRMNEFWFCTHPEIFVQRCLPDDPEWQCLPKDKRIGSVAKFLALPDLRQGFYSNNLKLLPEQSCVIEAKVGKCNVGFLAPKKQGKELEFSYELLAASVDKLDVNSLPLLVLYTPNQRDTFTFELSLPAPGDYRLKVRVGSKGQKPLPNCYEVKIVCSKADPGCKTLPIDTGIQGWGFTQDAADVGLKKPSVSGAKIRVNKGRQQAGKVLYKARVDPDEAGDRDYLAYICSDDGDRRDQAIVTLDKGNRNLEVKAPNDKPLQNSALVVTTKHKKEPSSKEKAVANYLFSSDEIIEKDDNNKIKETRKKIRGQEHLDKKLAKKALLEAKKEQAKKDMDAILAKLNS